MRLDKYLSEKLNIKSRTKGKEMIEKGLIAVNNVTAVKPSFEVKDGDIVEILSELPFVSKGGEKLYKGIECFLFSPSGKVFLDVGASNGGFTDCLLSYNAKKVYAIDVGENQLDETLKTDSRVVVMDKTNARNLSKDMFAESELYAVSDVSFISLTLIIPPLSSIVREMLLLVKPQFECGKKALSKNGIVTSPKDRLSALLKVSACLMENGFGMTDFTIGAEGKDKNTEYVIMAVKGADGMSQEQIASKFSIKVNKYR